MTANKPSDPRVPPIDKQNIQDPWETRNLWATPDLRLNYMNFETFVILGRIENLILLQKEFKK